MKIMPFHKYLFITRTPDKKLMQWNLEITPEKKAWKLANFDIQVGDIICDHTILFLEEQGSIEEIFLEYVGVSLQINQNNDEDDDDDNLLAKNICPFCWEKIRNGRCTGCHFDFDD